MKKHFPEWEEEPVQEFKCYMNERTNRGALIVGSSAVYFYSTMLGGTKVRNYATQGQFTREIKYLLITFCTRLA
jgi:hypothetical protein